MEAGQLLQEIRPAERGLVRDCLRKKKRKDLVPEVFSLVLTLLVAGAGFGEVTMNFGDKFPGRGRRAYVAVENLVEWDYASVKVPGGFIVLLNLGAVDVNSGEESL